MSKSYPEINAIDSVRECNLALRMGYSNLDSLKPEAQDELRDRLKALELRKLQLRAIAQGVR